MSPVLAALPPEARGKLRRTVLDRGDVLFRTGASVNAMFYVVPGEVRLVRLSRAGGMVVLQRTRNGFFAEASLAHGAYHCDAVAAVASVVLAIPRGAFGAALADEGFRVKWFGHLGRELRRSRTQCERLTLRTARERVIHFIETEGAAGVLQLAMTKKDWAAELGITHEALYRTLATMQKSGEISADGEFLRLEPVIEA
ncbi:MAG: Crp/Fnr family transcriptional regulator [Hyphomicrobiaceae bacterium]